MDTFKSVSQKLHSAARSMIPPVLWNALDTFATVSPAPTAAVSAVGIMHAMISKRSIRLGIVVNVDADCGSWFSGPPPAGASCLAVQY